MYVFAVFVADAVNVILVLFGIVGHVNVPVGFVVLFAKYVVLLLVHLSNAIVYPVAVLNVITSQSKV